MSEVQEDHTPVSIVAVKKWLWYNEKEE